MLPSAPEPWTAPPIPPVSAPSPTLPPVSALLVAPIPAPARPVEIVLPRPVALLIAPPASPASPPPAAPLSAPPATLPSVMGFPVIASIASAFPAPTTPPAIAPAARPVAIPSAASAPARAGAATPNERAVAARAAMSGPYLPKKLVVGVWPANLSRSGALLSPCVLMLVVASLASLLGSPHSPYGFCPHLSPASAVPAWVPVVTGFAPKAA